MKTRKIKRLFNGLASLRDYEVEKFIKAGGVKLILGNESMLLSVEDLQRGTQANIGNFVSNYDSTKSYFLIDFKWRRR